MRPISDGSGCVLRGVADEDGRRATAPLLVATTLGHFPPAN
jgi:hypothetical protein